MTSEHEGGSHGLLTVPGLAALSKLYRPGVIQTRQDGLALGAKPGCRCFGYTTYIPTSYHSTQTVQLFPRLSTPSPFSPSKSCIRKSGDTVPNRAGRDSRADLSWFLRRSRLEHVTAFLALEYKAGDRQLPPPKSHNACRREGSDSVACQHPPSLPRVAGFMHKSAEQVRVRV